MTTWSSNDPKGIHALSPGNNGTERCYWHPTHTKCGSPSITRGCGILIAIFLCLGWLETQNCLEYLWRCAWCTVSCSDISWLNKFRFYKLFLKYINELRHIPSNLQESSFVEMRCVLDALPCGGRWQCGCLDSMDTERERERENSNRMDRLRPLLKLLGEAPAKAGHTDIPTTWCLAWCFLMLPTIQGPVFFVEFWYCI